MNVSQVKEKKNKFGRVLGVYLLNICFIYRLGGYIRTSRTQIGTPIYCIGSLSLWLDLFLIIYFLFYSKSPHLVRNKTSLSPNSRGRFKLETNKKKLPLERTYDSKFVRRSTQAVDWLRGQRRMTMNGWYLTRFTRIPLCSWYQQRRKWAFLDQSPRMSYCARTSNPNGWICCLV